MNINRLRPTGVAREDLDLWLSGVIWDAMRDAREAGLTRAHTALLLRTIARMDARGVRLPPDPLADDAVQTCSGCGEVCMTCAATGEPLRFERKTKLVEGLLYLETDRSLRRRICGEPGVVEYRDTPE